VGPAGVRDEAAVGAQRRPVRHLAAVEAGRPTEYYASSL
jgi:hypothetical protein